MRLVAQGDQQAFADLYDATSDYVYGIALTVLRSPEPAVAASQEIYADVWREAARFDPNQGNVLAWLMSLAHRRVAERARAVAPEVLPDRYAALAAVELDLPAGRRSYPMEVEPAREALGTLSEDERQAVTLAYFGGYSQSEVARILDLPLDTVKTRLRDGLAGLRDAMGVVS
jgi:RNA polymerase sigma-70 factor (ECF subfamily)